MDFFMKKKRFLNYLSSWPYKGSAQKFFINQGPGLVKKIKRLIFSPSIYIPYCLYRLGLYRKKDQTTKLFWGRQIKVSLFDLEAFFLNLCGLLSHPSEVKLTKFFIKNFKENDIFYDVGANWGFYTYLALEFCSQVHSFEPLPNIFKYLLKNLSNEHKCFLNNVALSNFCGESKIYSGKESSRGSTIRTELFLTNKKYFEKEILVKVTTLDEYLKTHSSPTVIKLDVEGSENLVIKGGIKFFKNFSPIVAMEVASNNHYLANLYTEAIRLLKSLGYKSFYLNEEGELKRAEGDLTKLVEKSGYICDNFIFLK